MAEALYNEIGEGYAAKRQPDPRISVAITNALGDAASVINVGAGAGSYEPTDRDVLAVEPSELMIQQRATTSAPCIRGVAEALPVASKSFDAAMAILTIHHWNDWRLGLHELKRVARRRIVIFTFDPNPPAFWLKDQYLPELAALDSQSMPPIESIVSELGSAEVIPVPIPHDCIDGFLGAYWRRPYAYLDADVRRSISSFSKIDADAGLQRLHRDLDDGSWNKANRQILELDSLDLGYRLIQADFK